MTRAAFYQQHLNRVSRSFAFCIEQLSSPYREWIGLSYILCRLVDTIEDSNWPSLEDQLHSFDEFIEFVSNTETVDEKRLQTWLQKFPSEIPKHELELLNESQTFFQDLHSLPADVQQYIQSSVLNMARGMRHFCENHKNANVIRLPSLAATNQYCFFVAGVVGELLTQIFYKDEPGRIDQNDKTVQQKTLLNAFHFGLYLQKINLLKDQLTDEAEGRLLVSSREGVRESLQSNASHALQYLQNLPTGPNGFRLFCGWSLFLGLASLPMIDKSWNLKKAAKISRTETFALLSKVKAVIDDNAALEKLFAKYLGHSSAPTESVKNTAASQTVTLNDANSVAHHANAPATVGANTQLSSQNTWMSNIYEGQLNSDSMADLFR